MNKQNKQKGQFAEPKEQQTNWQKFTGTMYRLYVKQENMSTEISHALVASSYLNIFTIVNIIMLFTFFTTTNSLLYSIVISSLLLTIFLIDIIPRISQKHLIFQFVSLTQGLILMGIMVATGLILFENYSILEFYCETFQEYYSNRDFVIGPKSDVLSMCSQVRLVFIAEIAVQGIFVMGKIMHVGLYLRAYRYAKEKFVEEEKKRRRKDRYNEMIRKRCVYNQKRKA